MEKIARKPSMDPAQEKLRQNKAAWNKDVSALVNDLIHFKKMMNGWPSKFFKERTRITEPIPADPSTIIGSLAGDFQDIVNRGNALIQEQINYSKTRRQKQPKNPTAPVLANDTVPATTEVPNAPPTVDLTKQLVAWEQKYDYQLISEASNPISRFLTRLMTPKIGFGEGARIRRLRITLLDACAKTYKDLKKLQNEIVKSSKGSIVNSHKLMTSVWNHWSIVARTFTMFKSMAPKPVQDSGGELPIPSEIQDEQMEKVRQEQAEETGIVTAPVSEELPLYAMDRVKGIISDYSNYGQLFNANPAFQTLESIIDKIKITPKANRVALILNSNIEAVYTKVLSILNQEQGTNGASLKEIANQLTKKKIQAPVLPVDPSKTASVEEMLVQAQLKRWLGKTRHQLLPGGTSGSRLEIYRIIAVIKKDLDDVMNLLQAGFDEQKLSPAIIQVNREITSLRTMIRSLHYSEKPEEIPPAFF